MKASTCLASLVALTIDHETSSAARSGAEEALSAAGTKV
jgi:hypothetical protein